MYIKELLLILNVQIIMMIKTIIGQEKKGLKIINSCLIKIIIGIILVVITVSILEKAKVKIIILK